ncbi:MAG: type II toxin-antitoxin system HicA family toxin [Cyanobacteria bacterium P01_G01_bin.54]
MPKKVRELKQMLKKAGFMLLPRRGKGSHSYWVHERLERPVVLSGKDGKDAKPYQEQKVIEALNDLEQLPPEN